MDQSKTDTAHTEKPLGGNDTHFEVGDDAGTAVQIAHDTEQQNYSPWTMHMWRLYAVLWVAYLCGCLNGYDGSLMGGVNAMTEYQNYFQV